MRVISDKLVFYEIDGDAGRVSGRRGDLGRRVPSLVKAAVSVPHPLPALCLGSGRDSQCVGCKTPDPIGFPPQENLSAAWGRKY